METLKEGQQVKFANPAPDENVYPMYIVWVDVPRAMVREVIPGWAFEPTMIVNINDIVPV